LALQRLPQEPQFVALVSTFVSQPLDQFESQLPQPELHRQVPVEQVALALQRLPQEPQFEASDPST
jgi:hypothetical protein